MKIIHILNDSNIGGAGKLLFNISSCIDRDSFEFVFIFYKHSKLIELFSSLGFRIYEIDCRADRSFDIQSVIKIRNIIKKEMPDIVHTHSSLSGKIALKTTRLHKIKSVYTKHCVFGVPGIMKLSPMRVAYGFIDNILSDATIAVAESAKDELIQYGVNKDKIKVIINGSHQLTELSSEQKLLLKQKLGIKNGEFIVGISARLERYKGHKFFLEAAKKAQKNNDNIKFLIMGDGSYRDELEKYSFELGTSQNVIFLGFVNDVAKYVNIFDVNVNCSIGTETSSLAISEGLSLGKPAIVSDYGGNPNMVINGITGCVVRRSDPEALYGAIKKLQTDTKLYDNMKKNAFADFNNRFSDIYMTQNYETFYKDLMA